MSELVDISLYFIIIKLKLEYFDIYYKNIFLAFFLIFMFITVIIIKENKNNY